MDKSTSLSWMHVNHYELQEYQPAMLQIANFLTQRRRVTATVTRLHVTDAQEPDDFWWDWMPAEIVIDSNVYSQLAETQWGITDAFCTRGVEGVTSPIYEFNENGEQQTLNHIVFDDFISEDEVALGIDLGCFEIDWSDKYEIFEPLDGDGNALGSTTISVSVTNIGTLTQEFSTSNFNGTLTISVFDYPFELLDEYVLGDVTGDGIVDVSDVLALISAWGDCNNCIEDLNNSGSVDVTDLLIVIGNWS